MSGKCSPIDPATKWMITIEVLTKYISNSHCAHKNDWNPEMLIKVNFYLSK